jgi:anti-anti-sigma factor
VRLADVQFREQDDAVIASVAGEIDLANAESIGRAVAESIQNQMHVLVLDMSDVAYIDSAGIRLIFQLREWLRARGQALRLVTPRASASHDALRLAGVAKHVETIETVDEALDSCEGLDPD